MLGTYRRVLRFLGKNPLARMLVAFPRTARFVQETLERKLARTENPLPRRA